MYSVFQRQWHSIIINVITYTYNNTRDAFERMQHVNRSSKARNSSLLAVSMSSSTAQPLLQAPVYTKTHCIKLRNIYLMKLTFASKYAHTMPGLRVKRQKIRFLKNKQKRRRCTNHHHVVCFYMPAEVLTRWNFSQGTYVIWKLRFLYAFRSSNSPTTTRQQEELNTVSLTDKRTAFSTFCRCQKHDKSTGNGTRGCLDQATAITRSWPRFSVPARKIAVVSPSGDFLMVQCPLKIIFKYFLK